MFSFRVEPACEILNFQFAFGLRGAQTGGFCFALFVQLSDRFS